MKKMKKKSDTILGIEERFGEEIEELLRVLYVDEGKTIKSISETLSITEVSVLRWLNWSGIYSHKLDIEWGFSSKIENPFFFINLIIINLRRW